MLMNHVANWICKLNKKHKSKNFKSKFDVRWKLIIPFYFLHSKLDNHALDGIDWLKNGIEYFSWSTLINKKRWCLPMMKRCTVHLFSRANAMQNCKSLKLIPSTLSSTIFTLKGCNSSGSICKVIHLGNFKLVGSSMLKRWKINVPHKALWIMNVNNFFTITNRM